MARKIKAGGCSQSPIYEHLEATQQSRNAQAQRLVRAMVIRDAQCDIKTVLYNMASHGLARQPCVPRSRTRLPCTGAHSQENNQLRLPFDVHMLAYTTRFIISQCAASPPDRIVENLHQSAPRVGPAINTKVHAPIVPFSSLSLAADDAPIRASAFRSIKNGTQSQEGCSGSGECQPGPRHPRGRAGVRRRSHLRLLQRHFRTRY